MTVARGFSGSCLVAAAVLACLVPTASGAISGPGAANRDGYQMFTVGDSYAAGEGAPDVNGEYDDNGDIQGDFEDWDERLDGPVSTPGPKQDSTRCHRSGGTSTSAVARLALQAEFPDINFNWVSVACSGASIVQTGSSGTPKPNKGGLLTGYDGVDSLKKRGVSSDSLSPDVYPPQIDQINTNLAARQAGLTRRVDALVMSIGGNDAGFAEIIVACLNIGPDIPGTMTFGDCNTNEAVASFVASKLSTLNSRFNRLAASLLSDPVGGDPGLGHQPADVFLTAVPNPLRPTATSFCDRQPPGNYEENLKAAESEWVEDNVMEPLNERFAQEADQHGWHLVDSHVSQFFGHAICSSDNWIQQNLQALRIQGELDETEGTLPIAVSGGIAHPNRDGYEAIGTALAFRMRPFVVDRYTPDSAPGVTTISNASSFRVDLGDVNLPALRSGYWHRIKLRQLTNSGITDVQGNDGLRDLGYGTSSRTYARTGRYFVSATACGPLSRDGTLGCGPVTAEVPVSTFVPARPVNVTAAAGGAPAAVMPTPGITVRWEHASPLSAHDTRRTVIRVHRRLSGRLTTVRSITHEGRFTSAAVKDLQTGVDYFVSVQACNDGDRCSDFTPAVTSRATSGDSPLTALKVFQEIKIRSKPLRCAPGPVRFDPALPGSLPNNTLFPGCPGDIPIGRLRLDDRSLEGRPGSPVAISVRWRHPSRWLALHEISVHLRVGRRSLATLRFNHEANTLTLARGDRRRGKSLPVGSVGTLRAGRVRVRLGKNAIVGSGPTGASVRLRFQVSLPRSARPAVVLAVGAVDDAGQRQAPAPAGVINLR